MVFDDYIRVPEGYHFSFENGIYKVLERSFKQKLDVFAQQLQAIQIKENYPFLPEHLVTQFPFIEYAPFKNEIRERQQDVKLLEKHVPFESLQNASALELGGWNGWLPRLLGKHNIHVISVGIFNDKNNGLGCRQFYKNCEWLSLQADIEDVRIYKRKFDLIVFEHNLSFQSQPLELLKKYEALLNLNGYLIVLGSAITANAGRKAEEVKRFRDSFQSKHCFKVDFYNSQGFFDKHFYQALLERDYRFISYHFALKNQLLKKLQGNKNGIFIYKKQVET